MIDPNQLRVQIVRPVLQHLGLHSRQAEDLVMGTAAQESHLKYVRQLGGGPALGLFQMEPATHRDIWDNYLAYRDDLASKVRGLASQRWFLEYPERDLIGNLPYATAMCRIHYRRVPAPIPDSVAGMAQYWKDYYNSHLGAGTVGEFMENFERVRSDT